MKNFVRVILIGPRSTPISIAVVTSPIATIAAWLIAVVSPIAQAAQVAQVAQATQAAASETCPPLPIISTNKISLSLKLAESRLIACNRDVLVAQRAVEAAEADRITAGQRPNPNLTLGASNINPRAGIGAGGIQDKTIDSSLRLDQLVERGGKGALRERQADATINAARADLQDVIRQQRLLLRQNYVELLFQQSRIKMQQAFLGYADASLTAAERKLTAGDIATSEANRFRLDNARARSDLQQTESDSRKAALELAKSIGAEAAAFNISAEAFAIPASDESDSVKIAVDLERRADLIAATHRIEAAEAARALAASIATRDVTLSAQFDRWPTSAANQQGTGNSFSVYLSIPLFVRHANEGEVKRAATDLSTSRDVLIRRLAQARAESRLSLESWRDANRRVARLVRDILPLAREVAKAAEFAYSKGATGVLDLLDARRTLKQIELDAALADADAGKAWAQWSASTETMDELVEPITSKIK